MLESHDWTYEWVTTIANGRVVVNNADALWRRKFYLVLMANTYSTSTAKNMEHENQECRTKITRMVWNAIGCHHRIALRQRIQVKQPFVCRRTDCRTIKRRDYRIANDTSDDARHHDGASRIGRIPNENGCRRKGNRILYSRITRLVSHQSRCAGVRKWYTNWRCGNQMSIDEKARGIHPPREGARAIQIASDALFHRHRLIAMGWLCFLWPTHPKKFVYLSSTPKRSASWSGLGNAEAIIFEVLG